MTTFEDGPAKGNTLMLKRAAQYLRVVQAADDKWDALDQLADTPAADEKLFAYEIVGKPGLVHLNMGRGRGGCYVRASYRFITPQPTDAAMRTTARWHDWCVKRFHDSGTETCK